MISTTEWVSKMEKWAPRCVSLRVATRFDNRERFINIKYINNIIFFSVLMDRIAGVSISLQVCDGCDGSLDYRTS